MRLSAKPNACLSAWWLQVACRLLVRARRSLRRRRVPGRCSEPGGCDSSLLLDVDSFTGRAYACVSAAAASVNARTYSQSASGIAPVLARRQELRCADTFWGVACRSTAHGAYLHYIHVFASPSPLPPPHHHRLRESRTEAERKSPRKQNRHSIRSDLIRASPLSECS